MIARRERKRKGKFEGKLTLKKNSCNKIGYFASRCPIRILKYKSRYDKRDTECYYATDGVSDESNEEDEIRFVAIKEEESIYEEKALVTHVEKKSEWIIDSGYLHHMTGDRHKFVKLNKFDGGIVRFRHNTPRPIIDKGSISLDGKSYTDDVLFVDGLKHSLLSVGQLLDKGYHLRFENGKCIIKNKSGELVASSTKTRGNVFQLNPTKISCLMARVDDSWLCIEGFITLTLTIW
jgi:hypothetical protein